MLAEVAPTLDTNWDSFEVSDDDLHFIYNLLLEREAPLTTGEMVASLIDHRLDRARSSPPPSGASAALYRPGDNHAVGDTLLFSHPARRRGRVIQKRPGENPDLPAFQVIQVEFDGGAGVREFASSLADHPLNAPPVPAQEVDGGATGEDVRSRHGRRIEEALTTRLNGAPDIVRIAGRWFPKALVAEIHEGHLNLAEAVLDVAGGGPTATRALLAHMEMPAGLDPLLAEFSLDYALQEDPRFDEVGPAGQVLWHLRRLEPAEVLTPPERLEYDPIPHDRASLGADLEAFEREVDDELSPLEPPDEAPAEVTLALLYPHWRAGTLPLASRLRPLFPTAYEAPRIRFILVDGHSGEKFPGWVVRRERYVSGLADWYARYNVPVGGLVRVRPGDVEGEVRVECLDLRRRNEWIRTVTADAAGRVGFAMTKMAVGTAYDERMVVGIPDTRALDSAWQAGSQRKAPFERLAAQVFRELAKLNPQSAVHAQALYSGLNVLRRVPPAPVLAELVGRPAYQSVGDLYWRLADGSGAEEPG
jgi:hypothetical protein